jgi:hypothetical protein
MQYLLSQDEMNARRDQDMLLAKVTNGQRIEDFHAGLTNVCKHVATTMIQTINVNGGGKSDRPHGCVHVKVADPRWQTQYCDGCQVAGICPQTKEWSK